MKTTAISRIGATALATGLAAVAAGCGGSSSSQAAGVAGTQETKGASVLVGAGSTLVAPLVGAWQSSYIKTHDVTLTYGAIGSGGGISQLTARTVDFAGSDAPLTPDQRAACKGCVTIPWALSATTVAYNVPGATRRLRLTGPVLAEIFLGKVTQWNDPQIAKLNPGAKLPAATPFSRQCARQ